MTISTVSELRRKILNQRHRPRVVTFDVFDTLVRRTLPHPDFTKVPAAKHLSELLAGSELEADLDTLLNDRLRIEWQQRLSALSANLDPECHIREVFAAWLESRGLGSNPVLLDELLELEIEHELEVVHATSGMPEFVQELRNGGFRVGFLSDMYLSHETVERILNACGYQGLFHFGHVSSESRMAKYSGRAFEQLARMLDESPDKMLHVGDGIEADIVGARKAKVSAILFSDRSVSAQQNVQKRSDRISAYRPYWKGALWTDRSIASPAHLTVMKSDPVYRLGFEYLGPIFTNFIERVIHFLRMSGAELVLFNAREGFLLQELYRRLTAYQEASAFPPCAYSFLTRKAIYTASLKSFGERELKMGFFTTTPTLRNFLSRFSLPAEDLLHAVRRAGFMSLNDTVAEPLKCARMAKLVKDSEFVNVREAARGRSLELLVDYLQQLDFWEKGRVAIVDVGWNGTTQDALVRAISDIRDPPKVDGYYMALKGGMVSHDVHGTTFNGIYHDYRTVDSGICFFRYMELFETACRAPHPTVVGLRQSPSGQVEPVFKEIQSNDYRAEQRDEPMVATLQSAILDYCNDYLRTAPFRGCAAEEMSPFILSRLDRLIRYPSPREAELLGSFSHSEDFGQSLVYAAENSNSEDADPVRGKRLTKTQQRILWREGQIARSRIPGLVSLFNGYRVARRRMY